MKSLTSLFLALIFMTTSFTPAFAQTEGVEKLVDRLENLTTVFNKQCLPPKLKQANLPKYFEENGLKETCWRYLTEINHLEEKLQKHHALLESKTGCQGGNCKSLQAPGANLISSLSKVEEGLSCTPQKKEKIKKQCSADLYCTFLSAAAGVGGPITTMMVPEKNIPKGCHLLNDSCGLQLATGFFNGVLTYVDLGKDLVKYGWDKSAAGAKKFWKWVSGTDEKTSTSQLTMAKASEDDGIFKMLIKDFPGTMKKIWDALVASLKEWMKSDILCLKWSGAPHLSQCLEPTENFDCISCKTFVNGLCGISGELLTEVIPAFFTGGLVSAAKYGAQSASKISKLFKVSAKTMKAIKSSKLATNAIRATSKVMSVSLKAINAYMLSPARKIAKSSYTALASLVKKGSLAIAETPAGKVLIFSGKALKTTGKVVIYPIENPATVFAFKTGQRTFDKLFTLGAPKLAKPTSVALTVMAKESKVESTLAKMESLKAKKAAPEKIAELEKTYHKEILPHRADITPKALAKSEDLDDVIEHLYPELKYGTLAKSISKDEVMKAEKELWLEISKMSEGPKKTKLINAYQNRIVAGEARGAVITKEPPYKLVVQNAALDDSQRFGQAMKTLNKQNLSPAQEIKLQTALNKAHNHAPGGEVYKYSWSQIREKQRLLVDGGFSPEEANKLIRNGYAGSAPKADFYPGLSSVNVIELSEETFALFMEHPQIKAKLLMYPEGQRLQIAKILQTLKGNGSAFEEALNTFKAFEQNFIDVNMISQMDKDAPVYLAEYIKRQKKLGLKNPDIAKKIEKAFGECK